jgi:hypothetical protein
MREVRSMKHCGEFGDLAKLGCVSWDATHQIKFIAKWVSEYFGTKFPPMTKVTRVFCISFFLDILGLCPVRCHGKHMKSLYMWYYKSNKVKNMKYLYTRYCKSNNISYHETSQPKLCIYKICMMLTTWCFNPLKILNDKGKYNIHQHYKI